MYSCSFLFGYSMLFLCYLNLETHDSQHLHDWKFKVLRLSTGHNMNELLCTSINSESIWLPPSLSGRLYLLNLLLHLASWRHGGASFMLTMERVNICSFQILQIPYQKHLKVLWYIILTVTGNLDPGVLSKIKWKRWKGLKLGPMAVPF